MAEFVRTRDRRRFEMLFQRHKRGVLAHLRRYVRDPARAEELAQDVFLRVYTTKSYTPDTRFRTWLYRVATNVALNELRRPEHQQRLESMDAKAEGAPGSREALPNPAPNPEGALAGAQLAGRIHGALAALPENQRAAFLMARQDALSHEEIAHALSTSVSAVKSLIHRALTTLRREAAQALTESPEGVPS
ncbi:MAG: sigma-70 family RNA polymerase sigma factor [Deltaproteobacteria bacterium]|nr:sigma-70 family RNA polymerase sigma factor [Deltaproteobacteria bacterium]